MLCTHLLRQKMKPKGVTLWQVFPELYLPVMEENNIRVLRPWRPYLPLPSTFAYQRCVARLNAYLTGLIRRRWAARQAGDVSGTPDTLDRVLQAIEVSRKSTHRICWKESGLAGGACDQAFRRAGLSASGHWVKGWNCRQKDVLETERPGRRGLRPSL